MLEAIGLAVGAHVDRRIKDGVRDALVESRLIVRLHLMGLSLMLLDRLCGLGREADGDVTLHHREACGLLPCCLRHLSWLVGGTGRLESTHFLPQSTLNYFICFFGVFGHRGLFVLVYKQVQKINNNLLKACNSVFGSELAAALVSVLYLNLNFEFSEFQLILTTSCCAAVRCLLTEQALRRGLGSCSAYKACKSM